MEWLNKKSAFKMCLREDSNRIKSLKSITMWCITQATNSGQLNVSLDAAEFSQFNRNAVATWLEDLGYSVGLSQSLINISWID